MAAPLTCCFRVALHNLGDTESCASALAALIQPGDAIGLVGDLAAGKTAFVQAFARALDVPSAVPVTSPTFTLVNEYRGGRFPIYHADLYRLEREEQLYDVGIEDLIRRADGVTLVEWSDRLPVLPPDRLQLSFRVTGETSRDVSVACLGARSGQLCRSWQNQLSSQ